MRESLTLIRRCGPDPAYGSVWPTNKGFRSPLGGADYQVNVENQVTRAAALRLGGYSFLILFLELDLIRYVPGYVRVFGFYLNLVLIATFLGMGVGLLRSESAQQVRWLALPAAGGPICPRQIFREHRW